MTSMDSDDTKAAIVCTLRMPDHEETTTRSFVEYHLKIGFSHIFLFFDVSEPSNSYKELCERPDVTACLRDEHLRKRLQALDIWKDWGEYYEDEVQARQSLNATLALEMCRKRGLKWLLHIDSDELFHVENEENTIHAHFAKLERDNVMALTYTNHEGVPENLNVTSKRQDYFRTITLFRRHFLSLKMSSEVRECMKWWERRTKHGQYFLAYDNGKSVTRVLDNVVPRSVHRWRLPEKYESRNLTSLIDSRSLDIKRVYANPGACVLHYVVCGLDWFWSKYKILGNFPSAWFGGTMPIAPCFHTDSRDVFSSGSREIAKTFFQKQVLLHRIRDQKIRSRHVRAGVLFRCEAPRKILGYDIEDEEDEDVDVEKEEEGPEESSKKQLPQQNNTTTEACTYDKAWILSNVAQGFLLPSPKSSSS